ASVAGKWIELLRDIAPRLERAAILFNPDTAPYADYYLSAFEGAARSSGIASMAERVRTGPDLEQAVKRLAEQPQSALVVMPDIYVAQRHNVDLLVSLAARYRLPAIYGYRFYVTAGGLFSYGPDIIDFFRQATVYVDRILRGAKPADLPVQQPTKFEF